MPDNALAVAVPAGYRDWRSVASLAIDAVSSAHSKRAYEKALKDFFAWYSAEARPPLSRAIVQQYRSVLESASLARASINLQLSAIRKRATEAAENDLLDRSVAQGIVSPKGVHQSGARAGNWLTREQARDLLAQPEIETTEGKRDRAILAVLLGCALRRSELAALKCGHIQQRDARWVFVDLVGRGKRVRTGPIPPFVKVAIDVWTAAAGISDGPLFRRVRRRKYSEKTPAALSERMIWHIVTKYARQTGLVDKLAPHDMRSYAECRIMPSPSYVAQFGAHSGFVSLRIIRHNRRRAR
jgi:site-specific recombinase XerD